MKTSLNGASRFLAQRQPQSQSQSHIVFHVRVGPGLQQGLRLGGEAVPNSEVEGVAAVLMRQRRRAGGREGLGGRRRVERAAVFPAATASGARADCVRMLVTSARRAAARRALRFTYVVSAVHVCPGSHQEADRFWSPPARLGSQVERRPVALRAAAGAGRAGGRVMPRRLMPRRSECVACTDSECPPPGAASDEGGSQGARTGPVASSGTPYSTSSRIIATSPSSHLCSAVESFCG